MEDGERVGHEVAGFILSERSGNLVRGAHFVVSALETCISAGDRAQEIFGNFFKVGEAGVTEGRIRGGN